MAADGDAACEERLQRYIAERGLGCEQLVFEASTHSVEEAVAAIAARMEAAGDEGPRPGREDFVKSICLVTADDELVVAIVKGEHRASTKQVAKALQLPSPPRLASPEEMLARTGYPAGGTPPFGFPARWLIDPKVMEKPEVIGGGGSPRALVRISTGELQRANGGLVVEVRK